VRRRWLSVPRCPSGAARRGPPGHSATVSIACRPVVVAVGGAPGSGKTTVAKAVALRLGVLLLTRDEFKQGLGWSAARLDSGGAVQFDSALDVAGGRLSSVAEDVMTDVARSLAAAGVSFVLETAVLASPLVDALAAEGARVVAVHVVASEDVVGARLRARVASGSPVAEQLLSQFERGEMDPEIFHAATAESSAPRAEAAIDSGRFVQRVPDRTRCGPAPAGPVRTRSSGGDPAAPRAVRQHGACARSGTSPTTPAR